MAHGRNKGRPWRRGGGGMAARASAIHRKRARLKSGSRAAVAVKEKKLSSSLSVWPPEGERDRAKILWGRATSCLGKIPERGRGELETNEHGRGIGLCRDMSSTEYDAYMYMHKVIPMFLSLYSMGECTAGSLFCQFKWRHDIYHCEESAHSSYRHNYALGQSKISHGCHL